MGDYVAKITNFKLSRGFNEATGNLMVSKEGVRHNSPEMLRRGIESDRPKSEKKNYDIRCEVYSFGILLWEIAECKVPYTKFENFKDITKKVIKGYREKFTPNTNIPKEYQVLVNEAVDQNPDSRPTFVKLLINLQDIFNNYTPIRKELSWIKSAIKNKKIKYIEWNELTNISEVGSGHFGSVSKARRSKTNDFVVLKKLNNSNSIQEDAFKHEIKILIRAYTCENIIRFIGITQGMLFISAIYLNKFNDNIFIITI